MPGRPVAHSAALKPRGRSSVPRESRVRRILMLSYLFDNDSMQETKPHVGRVIIQIKSHIAVCK